MRDYEPLPLEATAPLLDAVQEPVRRIHDLLEEVEQAARDSDVDGVGEALSRIAGIVVCLRDEVRGVR